MADKAVVTQTTLDAIGQAIIAKGGATAPMTPAQMPAAIAAIPSGGDGWVRPDGWADMEKIVAENQREEYAGSVGILVDNYSDTFRISGANAYLYSDGTFTTSSATHTWNDGAQKDDEDNLGRWVILYYIENNVTNLSASGLTYVRCIVGSDTTKITNLNIRCTNPKLCKIEFLKAKELAWNTGNYYMQSYLLKEIAAERVVISDDCQSLFSGCRSLIKIPDVIDLSGCTNANSLFSNCVSLKSFGELNLQSCLSCNSIFNACYSLKSIGDITFAEGCSANLMFINCINLRNYGTIDMSKLSSAKEFFPGDNSATSIPDVIDLRGIATSVDLADYWFSRYSSALRKFPTHVYANVDLKMNSVQIENNGFMPESIAEFDDVGDVVGGMVYNLNENTTGSSLTLTLPASLKTLYSSAELTKIGDVLTSKGWTLVW